MDSTGGNGALIHELIRMTVRFHKNGVAILEDASGAIHILDPHETLRDVAKYVWREESLAGFRVKEDDASFKDRPDVKFVKLSEAKDERLRGVHLDNDPYFAE